MKVYVIEIVVKGEGADYVAPVILKDEHLAHGFGFWLIGNDYEFSYKIYDEGDKTLSQKDTARALWIFNQFMKEHNFKG